MDPKFLWWFAKHYFSSNGIPRKPKIERKNYRSRYFKIIFFFKLIKIFVVIFHFYRQCNTFTQDTILTFSWSEYVYIYIYLCIELTQISQVISYEAVRAADNFLVDGDFLLFSWNRSIFIFFYCYLLLIYSKNLYYKLILSFLTI